MMTVERIYKAKEYDEAFLGEYSRERGHAAALTCATGKGQGLRVLAMSKADMLGSANNATEKSR
ncbi:unnamed protein product [Sphenostylis stenocarpa]|uniref:Uncharacterized protein n=1 Tax=Sphenostylis stenocarpa TaxID=92480 RepID=A0AA86VAK0_9FABA|nr:unnamed protein product [Sphenostylis stenocarpa]